MSRFAQFRSVLSDRPLEGLLYLLGAIYILAVLCFGFGLLGIPLAIVVIGVCGHYFLLNIRRYPRFKLSEIGTIEMDLATRSTGDLSPRLLMGTFILLSVLWTLTVIAEGATIVVSHFRDVGDVPRLDQFAQHLLLAVFGTAIVYSAYRNSWRRVLITDRGLFQVFDVTRPWPTNRPLDEPRSPLRAMQIYRWEQVARFHWSRMRGEHVLHLNVRQPWIPVPQLLSYRLPRLSEEGRQRLDQLLQQHVVETAGAESEGALATSGTV
jgi:hypothetical protein